MATIKERLVRFLRSTERYTKTDMVYFFKGNFWLNINRGLAIANGFALSIAFAHFLAKEEYGTYAFALAVLGFFSMPLSTSLGAGLAKGVSRGHHAIVYEGMKLVLPWSIGGGALLIGLGLYYLIADNLTLGASFILGGILLPVLIASGSTKSFLNSKGDFKLATSFNMWRTPLMTAVLIVTAWQTGSALWVIAASSFGNTILSLLLYFKVRRVYGKELSEPTSERFASRYGFHSGMLSVFSYLSEKIDSILLWKFAGAAPVAVFTYALSPVRELRALIENQSTIAIPKFAQKEFSEVRANLIFRIKQMYLVAVPLMALYMLAAPYIYKFLFPQYADAAGLSMIAALSLLSAPRKLMSAAISAHQKIRESYIMLVFPNIARLILACALIPPFGIRGALAALLIAEVVDYIVLGILMRRFKEEL